MEGQPRLVQAIYFFKGKNNDEVGYQQIYIYNSFSIVLQVRSRAIVQCYFHGVFKTLLRSRFWYSR